MLNRTRDYFNEAYRRSITPWVHADIGPEGQKFIQLCKAKRPKGKLLDLGCGDGKFAILLAQNVFES